MRVATFNILHGAPAGGGAADIALFAEAVASLDADVLALQEVDQRQSRSGRADLATVAADAMGAVDHRFAASLLGRPDGEWVAADGTERPHDTAYGIALLSRYPVVDWKVLRLPRLPVRSPWPVRGRLRPRLVREEPRVAVAAVLDGPRGPCTVACTHLSFLPWSNGRQLRALTRALTRLPGPQLLAGDLNMGRERAVRITGMLSLAEAATYPVDHPSRQVDHVLGAGPGWRVRSAGTHALPVSDHCALVVDVA